MLINALNLLENDNDTDTELYHNCLNLMSQIFAFQFTDDGETENQLVKVDSFSERQTSLAEVFQKTNIGVRPSNLHLVKKKNKTFLEVLREISPQQKDIHSSKALLFYWQFLTHEQRTAKKNVDALQKAILLIYEACMEFQAYDNAIMINCLGAKMLKVIGGEFMYLKIKLADSLLLSAQMEIKEKEQLVPDYLKLCQIYNAFEWREYVGLCQIDKIKLAKDVYLKSEGVDCGAYADKIGLIIKYLYTLISKGFIGELENNL